MEVSYQGSLPARAWYASSLDLGPFSCRPGTPKLSPSTYKLILGVSSERDTLVLVAFAHFLEERGRGQMNDS